MDIILSQCSSQNTVKKLINIDSFAPVHRYNSSDSIQHIYKHNSYNWGKTILTAWILFNNILLIKRKTGSFR